MQWRRRKNPWPPGYVLGAILEGPDGSQEFQPFCADDVAFCAPDRHCDTCGGPVADGVLDECPICRGR